MPSRAYTDHLIPLLRDADDLIAARAALRAGMRGRSLSALNRATVVICVSAWEAFIEELLRESLEAIRPAAPPMGTWPALNASVRGAIGRFNTPNTDQIRILFSDAIGLQDIQNHWTWPNCTPAQARARLQRAMDYRHAVAHGVHPRPAVDNRFSDSLIKFFRRLGQCTDAAVRQYLVGVLAIAHPWPA